MSEGDLSGMDKEVVEERVVAIDAVVASSNEGGVHGRRSGRPGRRKQRLLFILEGAAACPLFFLHLCQYLFLISFPWLQLKIGSLSVCLLSFYLFAK